MLAASLNSALGRGFVLAGGLATVFGAVSSVAAARSGNARLARTALRYAAVVVVAAVGAFVMMERALITRDFSLQYVQDQGSRHTPALQNFAALWSALEGSILLWVLVLSGFTGAMAWKFRTRVTDPLVAWAMAVMFAVGAFFFLLMLFPANPFEVGPSGVTDGPGPNPLLQDHVLMLFHPPLLYLGYVGFTVPFAFAIAALVTGRVGEGWLVETRRWALYAWGFLTIGILLGGWWSYEVLGWGGVWGWDAVENASFLPWLTGTAYIHSVMVQERRGMLRVWNLSLLVATFSLTILGTFLTRSGVIASVHSFSQSSIGPWLLTFFGIVVAVGIGLIGWRGDKLRAPGSIDSPISREGAFLANNILFAAFAFVVLLGTVFPLFVEALQDRQIVVGAPYFNRMAVPIGITLLFLMAIAPALPWRKASTELLRDRLFWPAWCGVGALVVALVAGATRFAPLVAIFLGGFAAGAAGRQLVLASRRQGWRGLVGRTNGGMIVHLGVILVAVALVCSTAYSRGREFVLTKGVPVTYEGHTFEFVDVRSESDDRTTKIGAGVRIDGGKVYEPAFTLYLAQGMSVPTPSVRTGLTEDLYLTLTGTNPPKTGDTTARVKVEVKPLVLWLWIGGGMMAAGTVLAAFPGRRRRRPTDPASAPISTAAPAAPARHEMVEA
jgi:cytochrome c-type biogenesis protein CcmF